MKVNIINLDSGWILGKFAVRLQEELSKAGVESVISRERKESYDINHHVMFDFVNFTKHPHDTFMIAHVDQNWHVRLLQDRLNKCGMGICMSEETMDKLTSYGLPRNKLCYVNPAHDHVMKPRKYIVGITHKCHNRIDFRKREDMLIDIAEQIDPGLFKFIIMGEGWENIITRLRELGIEVDYYDEFVYDKYTEIIPSLDYYFFFGMDEGSMGFLDALAAGVQTIVTPQGFHLDAKGGITYSGETVSDFVEIFNEIGEKKRKLIASVNEWTWENFARKHLEIWHYLLGDVEMAELYKNRGFYKDGIFSVLPEDYSVHSFLVNEIQNRDYKKIAGRIIKKGKRVSRIFDDSEKRIRESE